MSKDVMVNFPSIQGFISEVRPRIEQFAVQPVTGHGDESILGDASDDSVKSVSVVSSRLDDFLSLVESEQMARDVFAEEQVAGPLRELIPGLKFSSFAGVVAPFQCEGVFGDHFFYLKMREGTAILHVARVKKDVFINPDFSSSMVIGEDFDFFDCFINLVDRLDSAEKLYFFPVQPRWNAGKESFDDGFCSTAGELMIGPWFQRAAFWREDVGRFVWSFSISGVVPSRGVNMEDAWLKLHDPQQDVECCWQRSMGVPEEQILRELEMRLEALHVGVASFGGPLELFDIVPDVPAFLCVELADRLRDADGLLHWANMSS